MTTARMPMSAARAQALLWVAQRATAFILALCIIVHLATMILAVRGGLSAAALLARTQGNTAWAAFYVVFVIAAAVHAPIGLRNVLMEWRGWRGRSLDMAMLALALGLAFLGLRAVYAVTVA
jgi:fumarate reductase subunit C